jgi:Flp pilus assembly protein TadB
MAKSTAKKDDPVEWSKHILIFIGLWLIFVGIRFVYGIHPVSGIVCIIAGVALIIFYFWIRDKSIIKKT